MTSVPFSLTDFPDPSQSPWTHPDTGVVYEYDPTTGGWSPISGGGGEFPDIENPDQQPGTIDDRYVNRTGDTMTGSLVSPALTTGPDDDDKSILYMDDGQDAYNVGAHELEAKSGANGGLYFDGNLLAKDADLTALSVELNGVGDNVREKLNELDDVAVSGATDAQILAYDAGSGNWVARDGAFVPPSVDFQREIDCSVEEAPDSPAIGELYIQHRADEADGVTPLASWTGITAATVNEGDFIVYGSDSEWHIAGNNLNSSVQADWSVVDTTDPAFIKNKPTDVSTFNNDANYLTQGNGTTAIVSATPPITKTNGDPLDVGQLWLSSENLELHVWANGWKQIDTNDGGGGSGGDSGGGGGGALSGMIDVGIYLTHFAPSGLIESCGQAKIGDTIVAAGIAHTYSTYTHASAQRPNPPQIFAVSTDGGKSWTHAECPIDAARIDSVTEGGNGKFYAGVWSLQENTSTRIHSILESSDGLNWTVVNTTPRDGGSRLMITSVGNVLIFFLRTSSNFYAWTSTDYGRTLQTASWMQDSSGRYVENVLKLPDGGVAITTSKNTLIIAEGQVTGTKESYSHMAITKSKRIIKTAADGGFERTRDPFTTTQALTDSPNWEPLKTKLGDFSLILFAAMVVNGEEALVLVARDLGEGTASGSTINYSYSVLVSTDEGETWTIVSQYMPTYSLSRITLTALVNCSTTPRSEFPYLRIQTYPSVSSYNAPPLYAKPGLTYVLKDLENPPA